MFVCVSDHEGDPLRPLVWRMISAVSFLLGPPSVVLIWGDCLMFSESIMDVTNDSLSECTIWTGMTIGGNDQRHV